MAGVARLLMNLEGASAKTISDRRKNVCPSGKIQKARCNGLLGFVYRLGIRDAHVQGLTEHFH